MPTQWEVAFFSSSSSGPDVRGGNWEILGFWRNFVEDLIKISSSRLAIFRKKSNSWLENFRVWTWSGDLPKTIIYPNFDSMDVSRAWKLKINNLKSSQLSWYLQNLIIDQSQVSLICSYISNLQLKLLWNHELSKLPPLVDVHNLRSRAFIPRTSRQLPGQYYCLLY